MKNLFWKVKMWFKWKFLKQHVRYFFQRRFRGWDDSETWCLDQSIAKFILPRLKRFKELNNGYPGDLDEEGWNQALDKMIFAFEWAASDAKYEWADDGQYEKVKEGLKLFQEYYFSLWW